MSSLLATMPPGTVLILGALLIPFLKRGPMQYWLLVLPLLSLAHQWSMPLGHTVSIGAFEFALEPVRVDRFSRIWGLIFHIAAFLTAIYSLHVRDKVQHVAGLMYAGSAIAAVFAGDLISLFTWWEMTALTSVWLIWARRTDRAYAAGQRYLIIQVGSGVLLLAGILFHYALTDDLRFTTLNLVTTGGWLIFIAFGIKAAFPFLHNWLQDAYPEATPVGTVYLSSFTTKLAIYALARGFAGPASSIPGVAEHSILIPIGAAMTAFPIFYAVIENDLRRVLAYSLNNQLGYMVVGIGIGTELAINGAAAHAFAHILYKGLLFMSMGAVLHRVGTVKGSELGGLWRSMPYTMVFCVIGAMAISAFPLFSGFVSKSLIVSAAGHKHFAITYAILLFASAGVFHHSGIKIPYFAFFAHDAGHRPKEAPTNMLVAMFLASVLCVGIGMFPGPLYSILPFENDYAALPGGHHASYVVYTGTHVITQLQLLLFSAVAFVFLQKMGLYPPELRSTVLDTDWSYRRLLPAVATRIQWGLSRIRAAATVRTQRRIRQIAALVWETHGPRGVFALPWPTGRTAFWAAVLLAVYVLLGQL